MEQQKRVPMGTKITEVCALFTKDLNRIADYVDNLENAYIKLAEERDQVVAELNEVKASLESESREVESE
jgi:hypothetical protein